VANVSRRRDVNLEDSSHDPGVEAKSQFEEHAAHEDLGLKCDRLRIELAEISARLVGVENEIPSRSTLRRAAVPAVDAAEPVRSVIAARRRRARFFPSDMFADPAWDILLDLYLAEIEQRRTVVSSLCAAAYVPATTALRWITSLANRGMLTRRSDPLDRRRVFVELTPKASDCMRCYFDGSNTPPVQPDVTMARQ
jgi:hypothetical protein